MRTFGAVKGKPGEIAEIGEQGIRITAHGGQIEALKVKAEDGKKMGATEFALGAGLTVGTVLGS